MDHDGEPIQPWETVPFLIFIFVLQCFMVISSASQAFSEGTLCLRAWGGTRQVGGRPTVGQEVRLGTCSCPCVC